MALYLDQSLLSIIVGAMSQPVIDPAGSHPLMTQGRVSGLEDVSL